MVVMARRVLAFQVLLSLVQSGAAFFAPLPSVPCVRRRTRGGSGGHVALNMSERDKMAEYIADKGLEGSGVVKVVNGIVPPGFRLALYTLFGVVGAAGVTIAISQNNFLDAGVNGAGLVLMLGLAFFDVRSQQDQVSSARSAMNNPDLGKDMYNDENTAKIDNVGVGPADGENETSSSTGNPKIQTAADLFGRPDDLTSAQNP